MPRSTRKPPPMGARVRVHAVLVRGPDPDQSWKEVEAGRRRSLWTRTVPWDLPLPKMGTFVGLRVVRDTQRIPGYYDPEGGEGPSAKVLKAHATWLVAFSARGKHWHVLPEDCEIEEE